MQGRLRQDAMEMNGGAVVTNVQIHNCGTLASAVRWPLCDDPTPLQVATTNPAVVPPAPPAYRTACNLLYPFPFFVESTNDNLYHVRGGTNIEFEEMEKKLEEKHRGIRTHDGARHARNGPGALFHAIWNAGFKCKAEVIYHPRFDPRHPHHDGPHQDLCGST